MTRPNIVIFMPDQMHNELPGPGGLCETPNFDALAESGVNFRNGFTPSPICSPARASAQTGLMPHQHRIAQNTHGKFPMQDDLPPGIPTFADLLSAEGYDSCYIGKWHVGKHAKPDNHGYARVGARYFMPHEDKSGWTDCVHIPNELDEKNLLAASTDFSFEQSQAYRVCRAAARFIRERAEEPDEKPFLLFASTDAPHVPWYTPRPYAERYNAEDLEPWPSFDDDLSDKPLSYRKHYGGTDFCSVRGHWDLTASALTRYFGMVTMIDEAFGQVLAALEDTGTRENTLVIVTSDHGDFMGRHGLIGKDLMFSEDLVRVPYIASWPAGAAQGLQCETPINHCDLFPTIMHAVGTSCPEGLYGDSFLPALRGEDDPERDDTVFLEHHGGLGGGLIRGIRTPRYKYTFRSSEPDELYDLQEDPWEVRNLAAEPGMADIKNDLAGRLEEWCRATDDPFYRGIHFVMNNRPC